jgi:hypothetical protein
MKKYVLLKLPCILNEKNDSNFDEVIIIVIKFKIILFFYLFFA